MCAGTCLLHNGPVMHSLEQLLEYFRSESKALEHADDSSIQLCLREHALSYHCVKCTDDIDRKSSDAVVLGMGLIAFVTYVECIPLEPQPRNMGTYVCAIVGATATLEHSRGLLHGWRDGMPEPAVVRFAKCI